MIRFFVALGYSFIFSVGAGWAGDDNRAPGPNPVFQTFAYHPLVLDDAGPQLKSGAHLGSSADRSRSYLLDISEDDFSGKRSGAIRNVWDRIRNGFALPPLRGSLVAGREHWYGQRKYLVASISQKSRRYLFHIVEAVEKRGMPMELALLPFVESGFEPGALSTAQAAGLWQFIPGTAQRYRLTLSDHYDGRRDIVASTEAALEYLEFLHGIFKDWQLALAAYNWGEEAVLRAISRNQARGLATDYESLALPEETRYYLPKLMAIRNIVLSPELHGVELADIPNAAYFSEVDVRLPLDIQSVARLSGSSVEEILALNPSHKSLVISGRGKPAVLVPTERIKAFEQNMENYSLKPAKDFRKRVPRKSVAKAVAGLKVQGGAL